MNYVNRKKDFESINVSLQKYDVTYLLAGKACGISSFLEELEKRLEYCEVFRCNALTDFNLFSLLISSLNRSQFRKDFINYIRNDLGEYKSSMVSTALQGIPYAGDFLANLADGKEIPPVYAGNFSSAFDEIIIPYFTRLSNTNKIMILIDAAEQLSEVSYNLIANLAQIKDVQIVLAITDVQSINFVKLRNALLQYSNYKTNTLIFREPEETLVRELAEYFGCEISNDGINNILIDSRNNIHLIIDYFLSLNSNSKLIISELSKAIIFILHICKFGLDKEAIIHMLKNSNIFFNSIDEIIMSLNDLEISRFVVKNIVNNNEVYTINSISHPMVLDLLSSYSDDLYYKNLVYNFFDSKMMLDLNVNILMLMYELSVQFNYSKVKKYAKLILVTKLKNGDIIEPTLVTNSELDNRTENDTIIAVIYYMRERCYSTALTWLKSNKSVLEKPLFKHFEGILNNRTRNFDEAERILSKSIKTEENLYRLNILLAYYIVNCIHNNRTALAINIYNKYKSTVKNTKNYGYFLRNIASALPFNEKLIVLQNAIENFNAYNDQYGIYSSKCNLGIVYCNYGFPEKAIKFLKESETGLQLNGSNHLHIIYNDLGVCYLMLKDKENAHKYLELARILARNKMPTIITAINCACLKATYKNIAALEILKSIENDVLNHPVDSVRKKYFYNRLLVESMFDASNAQKYYYSKKHIIDKYVDNDTLCIYLNQVFDNETIINYSDVLWDKLYKCAGLVYWYVDPLKLI